MYEDHSIEEKYLYNFSPDEKKIFYRQQNRRKEALAEYQGKVIELMCLDSPAIFANYEPSEHSTPLEIKYILNRIAANDPRDKAFELGKMDDVKNSDAWAPFIAKALQNNTHCKTVVLSGIKLTDKGALAILEALRHKELSVLNLSQNNLTDKSFKMIDDILSEPQNKWAKVELGNVEMDSEMAKSLSKHKNLIYTPVVRVAHNIKGLMNIFTAHKEHLK